MKRLMAFSAVAALISTTALADTATSGKPLFGATIETEAATSVDGFYANYENEIFASELLGKPVYAGGIAEAEAIGDVNDIVFGADGRAEAVIVGVGGFLGIGEKEVALDLATLSRVDQNGELKLFSDRTREQLEAAPAFERPDRQDLANAERTNVLATDANGLPATVDAQAGTNLTASTETAPAADATLAPQADDLAKPVDPATAEGSTTIKLASDDTGATNGLDANGVPFETLSADKLIGSRVHEMGGEDIGEIGDVLVSSNGQVTAFVVDVGGFLGIGEKPIAIDGQDLTITKVADGGIYVRAPFTREQLEAQKVFDAEAFQNDPKSVLIR